MIAFIVGFILPVLVWILTLPLKIAMKLIEKSLKYSMKNAIRTYKRVSEKEKYLPNYDDLEKTAKLAWMSAKAGYKLTKFSLITFIKVVKLFVRIIEMVIRLLIWIAGIMSAFYTLLIGGAIVAVAVVIISVMSLNLTTDDSSDEPKKPSNNTVIGADNFMSIDWSQDFTTQLDKIESKDGVEARNWVELKIIEMNTMQKALSEGKIQYAISGFMTGLKAVESGQTSLTNKPNLTEQEVRLKGNGSLDTPMQFDTNWQKYNPYYTKFSRPSSGSKYYYPDAFYGIATRFSKSGVDGFLPKRTTPLYEKAFKDMGVEMTTDKLRFVRYAGNITNEYNAVFLENTGYVSGLTKESANDTVYANAMILIQFGELYGYHVNDKTVNLVKSMYVKSRDNTFSNWYYDKSTAIKAIYGMGTGGRKNYPSDLDKTTDFGVIDENGAKVNGSLFNYLVNKMPSTAKNAVINSSGLKVYNGSRSHYMRARYDLTAYLTGVYDLWWASNALGVLTDTSAKGTVDDEEEKQDTIKTLRIDKALTETAKKYAQDTSAERIKFGHAGVGDRHDSPSFAVGLMRELGYLPDGTRVTPRPLRDGNLTDVRTVSQVVDKINKNQSILVTIDGVELGSTIDSNKLKSVIKEGDILVSTENGGHMAVYVGQNSKGEHVTVESVTDDSSKFKSKANMELTGESYGFGFTNLDQSEYLNKYNYVIRLVNSGN